MNNPELVQAVIPVVRQLEHLAIRYYVGGSVASSVYGVARTTLDADLLADLSMEHVQPLVQALAGDYYVGNDQPELAQMRYEAASRLEASQADAWVKLAQLLVQGKTYSEAIDLLNRAQKAKPRAHIQRYLEKVEVAAGRTSRS